MPDLQDFSDAPVPEGKGPRYGWLYLTNVETAVTVCVPVFMFGAFLGQSLDALSLCLALLGGGALIALIASLSSVIGVKKRMSTALLVKNSFGAAGAKIVWLMLTASLFGWFGVQTEIFAKAFLALAEKMEFTAPNPLIVTLVAGFLMSSTAIIGIRGIGKLSQIAVPLLLVVMVYALVESIRLNGTEGWLDFVPEKPIALGSAIAAIIGAYSVGAVVMPDIKRFAKNKTQGIAAAILSLGLIYPLLLGLTALTSRLTGEADFMRLLLTYGFGPFALIVLMLATWTTNDSNLYSASLSLAPIFPRLGRRRLTAIAGALGTVCATFGIFENMIPFFMMLGVLTTPLFAIYGLDYLKRRSQDSGTNWTALLIWLAASFAGVASTPVDQFGLGLYNFTTVPGLDSLIAALALYGLTLFASSRAKSLSPRRE